MILDKILDIYTLFTIVGIATIIALLTILYMLIFHRIRLESGLRRIKEGREASKTANRVLFVSVIVALIGLASLSIISILEQIRRLIS